MRFHPAAALVQRTGGTDAVGIYLTGMVIVSAAATFLIKDRRGIPLGHRHEHEQARPPFRWVR